MSAPTTGARPVHFVPESRSARSLCGEAVVDDVGDPRSHPRFTRRAHHVTCDVCLAERAARAEAVYVLLRAGWGPIAFRVADGDDPAEVADRAVKWWRDYGKRAWQESDDALVERLRALSDELKARRAAAKAKGGPS